VTCMCEPPPRKHVKQLPGERPAGAYQAVKLLCSGSTAASSSAAAAAGGGGDVGSGDGAGRVCTIHRLVHSQLA
jgi:hypothetical protein